MARLECCGRWKRRRLGSSDGFARGLQLIYLGSAAGIRDHESISKLTCVAGGSIVCSALRGNADRALSRATTVAIAHPGLKGRGFSPNYFEGERELLFLPLMRINESGELEGALAESWEYSPESGSVTHHLHTDVRWHDGVPFTAHDIKFSMDLMTHPDVLDEVPDFFGTVEVLDDSTLSVGDRLGA